MILKKNNDSRITDLETNQANMGAYLKNFEAQVGQLAYLMKESSSRYFSSDTKKNPIGCMSITLRSGKELGDSKEDENEKVEIEKEEVKMDKEEKKEEDTSTLERILFPCKPSPVVLPFLFPQSFRKAKLDGQFAKFLNMLKKLKVNRPFVNALAQRPNYVKFMKKIMSNKKKLDGYGTVSRYENCSAIIQRKLP